MVTTVPIAVTGFLLLLLLLAAATHATTPPYEVPVTPHNDEAYWDENGDMVGGPDYDAIEAIYDNLNARDASSAHPAFAGDLPHYAEAIRDPHAKDVLNDVRVQLDEFERLDADGDRRLSEAELAASVAGEKVHAEEVSIFLQQLDGIDGFNRGNGDGYVDWSEYARAMFGQQAGSTSSGGRDERSGDTCRCCCEKGPAVRRGKGKDLCDDSHCNTEGGHRRKACCRLGGGCTWFGPKGGPCTAKEGNAAGKSQKTQRQRDLEYSRDKKWEMDKPEMEKRHRAYAAVADEMASAATPHDEI